MFDLALLMLGFIAAQVVGLIFLVAGLRKLLSPSSSVQSVEAYGLLPRRVARIFGIVLPWLELTIAALLLSGFVGGPTATIALALLLIFSLAQTIALIRGQEVPCGCFASLSARPVSWTNVASNLALVASCFLVAWNFPTLFRFQWMGLCLLFEGSFFRSKVDIVGVQLITAAFFIQVLVFK